MTIDERIEYLLKVQESHEANLNRLFELHAEHEKTATQTDRALARFISRTDETLKTMTNFEGGAQ